MKRTAWLGLVVGLVCTGIGTADAKPKIHDGFYLQLTSGVGYYSVADEADGTLSGVTLGYGSLLMGGTITPGLSIGGAFFLDSAGTVTSESGGMSSELMGVSQFPLGFGLYVDYYLKPTGGAHFQGFVGWGGVETSTDSGGAGGSDPTGLVLYIAGGYDFWITNELSLGGMVRVAYGALTLAEASYSMWAPALLATLTWH